jgi:KDO2-lipid IV(A) lauroyltransferase
MNVLGGVAATTATLPFSDLSVFGDALGAFVGGALRIRRAHVEHAMTRAAIANPRANAAAMYASLGTSVLEVLWLAGAARDLRDVVTIDASARRVLSDSKSRGAVLAASHTGNWEIASCFVAKTLPLLVVTKHLSVGFVDRFWQASRARYGVTTVAARGAYERATRHVRAGGAVAMMIDQAPLSAAHSIAAQFLGESAWIDRAPATVAARTGAMFVVPAARRLRDGTQELVVLDAIAPQRTRSWIDDATARANALLDRFVRENPSEWLWMHRRWKRPS